MSPALPSGSYGPKPTALDAAILDRVPVTSPGRRASEIAEALNYPYGRRRVSRAVTTTAEVRAILRGFEHLGRAKCRAGWWTIR